MHFGITAVQAPPIALFVSMIWSFVDSLAPVGFIFQAGGLVFGLLLLFLIPPIMTFMFAHIVYGKANRWSRYPYILGAMVAMIGVFQLGLPLFGNMEGFWLMPFYVFTWGLFSIWFGKMSHKARSTKQ